METRVLIRSSPMSLPANTKRTWSRTAEKKWRHRFSHYKPLFFQTFTASNSEFGGQNQAEIRTRPSSYAFHRYLQVWKGTDEKQPRKSGDTVFSIITLSVTMETSSWIWPNFKLIQAHMYVIITCKNEKNPIKKSREKVKTSFFPS